jgi:hypothetical protein
MAQYFTDFTEYADTAALEAEWNSAQYSTTSLFEIDLQATGGRTGALPCGLCIRLRRGLLKERESVGMGLFPTQQTLKLLPDLKQTQQALAKITDTGY